MLSHVSLLVSRALVAPLREKGNKKWAVECPSNQKREVQIRDILSKYCQVTASFSQVDDSLFNIGINKF
jgi:hypothetical protein